MVMIYYQKKLSYFQKKIQKDEGTLVVISD